MQDLRTGPALAYLYRRVSDEDSGDEGLSLPAQLVRLRRYCAAQGWQIAGEYEDVLTGKRSDRQGYQQLLRDMRAGIKTGRPVRVVVARVDRFGRQKLSEQLLAYEAITDAGAELHATDQGGVQRTLQFGMHATIARHEIEQMGERIRNVLVQVREGGWWVPTRAAWGYAIRARTPEEKAAGAPKAVLIKAPAECDHVASAFARVAAKEPVYSVARWVQTLPADARGGRQISRSVLLWVLRNPLYAGLTPDRRPGKWPAIVDRATWDAVQARLDGNGQLPPQGRGDYLLTGLLHCPACDGRMSGTRATSKSGRSVRRYQCNTGRLGVTRCFVTAPADTLDALVLTRVEPLIEQSIEELRAWADAELHAPDARSARQAQAAERRRLEAERARASQAIVKLTKDLSEGRLSDVAYKVTVADHEAAYQLADGALQALNARSETPAGADIDALLTKLGDWRARWRKGDVPARRLILSELLTRVLPRRDGRAWDVDPIWSEEAKLLALRFPE